MENRAFSAVCNLYKKWDGERCLGYEPQEYEYKLWESLRSLYRSSFSSNNAVNQTRNREEEPLFDNEELLQCRAVQFMKKKKKHKSYSEQINCEKGSFINRSFVAFYRKWEWKDGKKSLPNGSACFRFLKYYCRLEDGVQMKGYGTFIRGKIKDEKYDLKDVDLKVEDFLRNTPK